MNNNIPRLPMLIRLKKESDRRNYAAKHRIATELIRESPDEFMVDSEERDIMGITHAPTGFRFHLPREVAFPLFRKQAGGLNFMDYLSSMSVQDKTAAEDLEWIGVDLDGTLAKYDGWKGPDVIGDPIPKMVDRVKRAIGSGRKVKIFTARVAGDSDGIARRAICKWCRQHLGLELPVTCIKDQHCREIWDDIAKKVYKNTGNMQKTAASYRAENVRKLLLGDRHYPISYLSGEVGEFRKALKSGNNTDIEEELQDVMYAAQALAASRTGKDRRIVGANSKIKEFLRRRDAAAEMFREKGVPFSVDHLAGGSNIRKPEKVMKFFESAGKPISAEEASELSSRYSEWQPTSEKRAAEDIADLILTLKEAKLNIKGTPVQPKSPEQAEAGNYPKGHTRLHGMDITIENLKGQYRKGTSPDGTEWKTLMKHHYGYIKRTVSGADGDHVDVFIGPDVDSEMVFVVNQTKKGGGFDEHKCMLGFTNEAAARKGYLDNYEKGWDGLGSITALTIDQFKKWVAKGDTSKALEPLQKVGNTEYAYSVLETAMNNEKRAALVKVLIETTHLSKLAGEEEGRAPTPQDAATIKQWLIDTDNPTDEDFHALAESLGLNIHLAEGVAYDLVHELSKQASKDMIPGGKADKKTDSKDFPKKQMELGGEVEMEHVDDKKKAKEISRDHLTEFPDYYSRLKKMEDEAKKALGKTASGPVLSSNTIGSIDGYMHKKAQDLENVKAVGRLSSRELSRAIRDAIISEQGAVNQYETIADSTENRRAAEVLQDISNEEKVHVGELQALLEELDPENDELLEEGEEEVDKEASAQSWLVQKALKLIGRA